MKKCESCGEKDIPKKLHYCPECREIRKKEAYERRLARQREGYYQTTRSGGGMNFLKVENKFTTKLSKSGTIRLSIAVIRQAIRDKKWRWLESENSDLFFDLAEIDKGKFFDKVVKK